MPGLRVVADVWNRPLCRRCTMQLTCAGVLVVMLLAQTLAQAQAVSSERATATPVVAAGETLPDAPSPRNELRAGGFGTAVKTIGSDELHFLKYPFQKKAIKYDILFVGATAVLISTDEEVLHQVPTTWHDRSITISNASLGTAAAAAGGIYLTGLMTHDEHAKQTGMRTAEATIDSVIMYGAAKAIFARQRPFSGTGEGNFFAGNWTNGSFPSGHAMFTWTIASTVAHEYHSPWVKVAMYGLATTVSVTRVTSREHFPADVFVGSVVGYGIGTYVAHKDAAPAALHSQNRIRRVETAILDHVTVGAQ